MTHLPTPQEHCRARNHSTQPSCCHQTLILVLIHGAGGKLLTPKVFGKRFTVESFVTPALKET